jgi:hypothetical protein
MGLLASLIAYLGAATGIVVALLMAMTVFLATPDQPRTSAIASRLGKFAVTKNATPRVTAGIGQWEPSVTPGIREGGPDLQITSTAFTRSRVHTGNETSRKEFLYMLARQKYTRHLASKQAPDFESRFMGYVDEPSADRSLIRRSFAFASAAENVTD